MERAISASAWGVNSSEVPLGVHKAQRGGGGWGVRSLVCLLPFTPPSEPGQGTKPGQKHWLRLLPRVIFLGYREGARAAPVPLGWALTGAGLWGDRSISAGACPWAYHPGWTGLPSFHPSLVLVVWLELGDGDWGAGEPPLVSTPGTSSVLGLAADFSGWK